jgi:hypothetical protein
LKKLRCEIENSSDGAFGFGNFRESLGRINTSGFAAIKVDLFQKQETESKAKIMANLNPFTHPGTFCRMKPDYLIPWRTAGTRVFGRVRVRAASLGG